MSSIRGGRAFYGEAIGMLMLDTTYPLIPGNGKNGVALVFEPTEAGTCLIGSSRPFFDHWKISFTNDM